MAQNERNLTYRAYDIPAKRYMLEAKCRGLYQGVSGRTTPLLPEDWTDADAWQLARTLAGRMAHAKWYCDILYTSETLPEEDMPLKDIPHDCPADGQGEGAAAPFPFDLCTEVLHCGILAAANAPRALLPFKGTFGALEELFTGTVMTGSGPMLRFEAMLCLLPLSVSLEDLREKERKAEDYQEALEVCRLFYIWDWLEYFPCRDALLQAVGRIKSEGCYEQAVAFVRSNMAAMDDIVSLNPGTGWGYSGFLKEAIDLYLYQIGVLDLPEMKTIIGL